MHTVSEQLYTSKVTMRVFYCVVFMLNVVLNVHCLKNNACKTISDYYSAHHNPNCYYDFAVHSNAVEIIAYSGYPVEVHWVVTKDGYILKMFRIPNNRIDDFHLRKGPVFLLHGWLNSGANFLGLGRNSLPFILSDYGYDVWIGNFRGTGYSDQHVNLTSSDEEYWDYSADEISQYDVPAFLEYVSMSTGEKGDIIYIGHSMGTGLALMYSSALPEEAYKTVKLFVLLAPAWKLPNVKAPLFRILRSYMHLILKTVQNKHLLALVSQTRTLKAVTQKVCLRSPQTMVFCLRMMNLLFSGPYHQMSPKTLPVYFNQVPSGTSLKFTAQITDMTKGFFRHFDYGAQNFHKYGSSSPPPYDISKVRVPVFIIYAKNDWGATPQDSQNLYSNLPKEVRVGFHEVSESNFNHFDFLYGENASSLVYNTVLQVMSHF